MNHNVTHRQAHNGNIVASCDDCPWCVQITNGKAKVIDVGDMDAYHSLTLIGYHGDQDGPGDDRPLPGGFAGWKPPT